MDTFPASTTRHATTSVTVEPPLRSELFTIEQLERHARLLAAQHQITRKQPPLGLLPRLAENEAILRDYNLTVAKTTRKRPMTPATEWLLDNFYLVKEQIALTRRHLPRKYYKQLPRLLNGKLAGYPRVYEIVIEIITHVDGRVTIEHLSAFIAAYQSVKELTLGELWAVPIMLRLGLIENLRRIVEQLMSARKDRDLADAWADRMLEVADKSPSDLILIVSDLARSKPSLTSAFVSEFARRLQGNGTVMQLARHWLEQRLVDEGKNLEELIQSESHLQATDQVSVGNSITSLRAFGAFDWPEFVETLSVVEQILRADPALVYGEMDFATRDQYRHVVESIARYGRQTEVEVARMAIELAKQAEPIPDERLRHVGYYLVDKGRGELETRCEARSPLGDRIRKVVRRFALSVYVGGITLLTGCVLLWVARRLAPYELAWWEWGALALLTIIAGSQFAISVVNWALSLLLPPQSLPRMDYSEGLPEGHRALVVIPTMLSSFQAIDSLLERLEIHYLSNRDPNLFFALLTDFIDADQEVSPSDEPLLRRVQNGVAALNQKYSGDRPNVFFLFHRPRLWNPQEGVWMGWERKRGKLLELDAVLRGGPRDRFSAVEGDINVLRGVPHVVTLDTDTQLPRDSASRLIGNLAHILNRPWNDPESKCVRMGYSILQPRVAVSLPSAGRSWFVRLFAGEPGIDPYTKAVSDIYQDLFGEGSFIGKGIYDVEAFEMALGNRFPENRILSHDLLESCYARSALVSDVEFFEDYPASYLADARRRHRWIRGDWQIAAWLLPQAPASSGQSERNPLTGLARWKIFDNLRRSLVAPALLFLLLSAWLGDVGPRIFWAVFALIIVALPGVISAGAQFANKAETTSWNVHFRTVGGGVLRQLSFALFTLIFLPFEAYMACDAIVRTAYRLLAGRKQMLEWQTASESERKMQSDLSSFFRTMWVAPAIAAAVLAVMTIRNPHELGAAAVLLVMWFLSPVVAWWISLPIQPPPTTLSDKQLLFLQKTARKTWRFFETFLNDDDHWLPPDNYQEQPKEVLATRTSPTNIGLSMLSSLGAWDFGYITTEQLLFRLKKTAETLERMERHRGHFYNWYDTRTLKPLLPLYLSSVDSGNFAAHVLTLRYGLLELPDLPVANCVGIGALRHTCAVLEEASSQISETSDNGAYMKAMRRFALELAKWSRIAPAVPKDLADSLRELEGIAGDLQSTAARTGSSECAWWSRALAEMCKAQLNELKMLTPWVNLPRPPLELLRSAIGKQSGRLNELSGLMAWLNRLPTLREAARFDQTLLPLLNLTLQKVGAEKPANTAGVQWLCAVAECVWKAQKHADRRLGELNALAQRCSDIAEMDFNFLFDETRDLFSIGYNETDHRMDSSFYDLLASEARLTSYLAISQYQVQQDHWFTLGRTLVSPNGSPVLVSWTGSMFEYLMPMLVMPSYENTLLDRTCKAAVDRQIIYGKERGVPWGFSESGFNMTDAQLNYQYRAFGVPGLGLKRGLAEDLVVAPYATVMALMVAPAEACANLERLSKDGREGRYGFYEAIDYTPSRLRPGQTSATVQSFMAHHQGMSFLALAGVLLNKPMQRRFQANPSFKSAELLLQERIPKMVTPLYPGELEAAGRAEDHMVKQERTRTFTNPNAPFPEVHLLSNGRYTTAVTTSGGGFSQWKGIALTRWREDTTRDCWGTFCYVRDVERREVSSITYQPTNRPSRLYEVTFIQGRAEFRRRNDDLDWHTEISVSPEDDVELRRITITNRSNKVRTIELTSYAEVVLAAATADLAHPAFSNLFIETEILPDQGAIVCKRRARSEKEKPPYYIHAMLAHGGVTRETSFETDRSKFVGRCRSLGSALAMEDAGALSNSQGPVLDPIVSVRNTVMVEADQSVRVDLIFGVGESREAALALLAKYRDATLCERVVELAWTHSQVILHQLNATEADAQTYGRLATSLIYASQFRRAASAVLQKNTRGQSNLWSYGISGDLPIALIYLTNMNATHFAKQVLQAHAYWRLKGLQCDMVILTADDSVYRQNMFEQVIGLVASSAEAGLLDKPGGIFVRRVEQIQSDDQVLLQTVARLVLSDTNGTLEEQSNKRPRPEPVVPQLIPTQRAEPEAPQRARVPEQRLKFYNGTGGFSPDGKEYVVTLQPGMTTPAPWANVIANPSFGTVISESGASYTWAENSHEFRLTPWYCDPVSDLSGEAIYIRDDHTGQFWSPTPLPARGVQPYITRHGAGYSVFSHGEHGIESELTVFVAKDAPVKFGVLKVRNASNRSRRLSVFGVWEWVLGELRHKSLLHVVTEVDSRTGALLARNPYNTDFPGRVIFVDAQTPTRTFTGDRAEFLGRNGSLAQPAALKRLRLSGKVGAGLDPCAALHMAFDLAAGQEREIIFRLGAGRDAGEAQQLIQRFRSADAVHQEFELVKGYWDKTLGAVQVETPEPALDLLANNWLVYQVLSSRMWARSGYYQSSGAYGFRDQLQDSMSLMHCEPRLFREQILYAAAHQFVEGDVQHWWHPPGGRGVRTHFSDDYLWLPYAVCRYVSGTGDAEILNAMVPFLEGRPIKPEEEAYYDQPRIGSSSTLYEHCVRAINNGLKFGAHGLPLIGCGDWNDGMNLVGEHGKGESVWLGFFLHNVLSQFAGIARQRHDEAFAHRCLDEAEKLRKNIEEQAWDGEWYKRAWFDDGTPLGSKENEECQIDALPQSWSVIAGVGEESRKRQAMDMVDKRLVRRDAKLIQLFTPPFDKSALNPGYIKGYVPGVRENGGQYTHAAVWTIMAFTMMGDHKRAWELFRMILPPNHSGNREVAGLYKVEPYVVAADIYGAPPHVGRGGWTWYTGSAGWLYRLVLEHLLGVRLENGHLRFAPCVPPAWESFGVHYRFGETMYHIQFRASGEWVKVKKVTLDGVAQTGETLPLEDDGMEHTVEVTF